jgi:hypothetical protein
VNKFLFLSLILVTTNCCAARTAPTQPPNPPERQYPDLGPPSGQFHSIDEVKMAAASQKQFATPRLAAAESPYAGKPFKIQADHDAKNVTDYRLVQNGVTVQTLTGARTLLEYQMTGLPVGQYFFFIRAVNLAPQNDKCWTEAANPAIECAPTADTPPLEVNITEQAIQKFKVGDLVQAYSGTEHGEGVAVRAQPTLASYPFLGVHAAGVKGKVLEAGTFADNLWWVRVDYEVDPDGWSTESNLEPCTNCTAPVSPPTVIKTVTRCSFALTANPPDATTGWKAQFQQNGLNIGNVDSSAPYQRTANLAGGVYDFRVIWTKTGQPTTITPVNQQVCQ